MITLQVPEGDKCKRCMFLRVSYVPERAKCALFGEDLSARYKYGSMDEDTIAKCDKCPTANTEISGGTQSAESDCSALKEAWSE